MSRIQTAFVGMLSFALTAAFCLPLMAADAAKKPQEKAPAKPAVDRYAVPQGDNVAALEKFIQDLTQFEPSASEIEDYEKKVIGALTQAAEKILTLEKNTQSSAWQLAKSLTLQLRLRQLLTANEEEQKKLFGEVKEFLAQRKELNQDDLSLAFGIGMAMENVGKTDLAIEAYSTFGKQLKESKDENISAIGEKMLASARRLNLVGNEMQIEGKTVDGKPFDWKSYRGKVVLVDFWATWCGPCVGELPNVKRTYELYKDKGFAVVGISLDEDRSRLEKFLSDEKIPWVCLFEDNAGWNHPVAAYYGIMAIPAVILVGKDGKVVHLEARGEVLGAELARLLGPAEQKPEGNAGDSKPAAPRKR